MLMVRDRRKYRKMRAKFEETMAASNQLIMDEWKTQALARRLQEQNEYSHHASGAHCSSINSAQPNS